MRGREPATSMQLLTTSSKTSMRYSSGMCWRQRWMTWLPLEWELRLAMLPRSASMMSFTMSGSLHTWMSRCTLRVPWTL